MKWIKILIVILLMIPLYTVRAYDEETMNKLEDRIKESLLEGNKEINVKDLKIKSEDISIFTECLKTSPYLYSIFKANYSYVYQTGDNGYVETINVGVDYQVDNIVKINNQIDNKLEEIYNLIDSSMNDEQIALIIHDYLIINCEYEYVSDASATSGGLLLEEKAICDGYAHAYQYILNHFGIECYIAYSKKINHAWNIVKIDNQYYHVDPTWDDPIQDRLGLVSHTYFLLSDSALKKDGKHSSWSADVQCTSTKYDDNYMKDAISPICINNNNYYYVNSNGIMKNSECILTLPRWSISLTQYWEGKYSGLFIYDNELYYNTNDSIMKMSLNGTNKETLLSVDGSQGYIYGIRLHDNKIEYTLKNNPNDSGNNIVSDIELLPILKSMVMSEQELKIKKDETYQLQVIFTPSISTNDIEWSSSDDSIVSVDNGYIKGLKRGSATIYAKYNDTTVECHVKVTNNILIRFFEDLIKWFRNL